MNSVSSSMGEAARYLGLQPVDSPVNVNAMDVHNLVEQMQRNGLDELSGVHRAPCIVRQQDGLSVVHPVLFKSGPSYAGLAYDTACFGMTLTPGADNDGEDQISLSLRIDEPETTERIGILAYKWERMTPSQEQTVRAHLDASLGFTALRAELTSAAEPTHSHVRLYGEAPDDSRTELPLIEDAAEQLVLRLHDALWGDLATAFPEP